MTAIHILAVDDDADNLLLTRKHLEQAGLRVTTAETAQEARRRIAEGNFEVLLVDLSLPDGDGLDLLALAREKDLHAVAVVLTGDNSAASAVNALRRGAYDYLVKPCPTDLLVERLRRAAERYRQSHAADQGSGSESLKLYVRELREAHESRGRFLENVIHELKTPLSVIKGYASFLQHRPPQEWKPEELSNAFQAVHRNAEILQALLDELTEAIRLSAHKIRLKVESLDVCEEAAAAVEAFRPEALQRGIWISAETAGPAMVPADRVRLRQVLSNLISNALKFTPPGGRITVRAGSEGGRARLVVEDTGVGIPREHLPRIFERYYQAEDQPGRKGLGLGLEITRGLVDLHGGRIWAESEPGRGSRFFVEIPLMARSLDDDPEADKLDSASH